MNQCTTRLEQSVPQGIDARQNIRMNWQPRGADPAIRAALYPDIPAWMERPLLIWAAGVSSEEYFNDWANMEKRPDVALLQEYETAARRPSSLIPGFRGGGVEYLRAQMTGDEFLDFVDFLVYKSVDRQVVLEVLEVVLSEAGSEWTIGSRGGHASLEKRVPEGVMLAAEAAMRQTGTAGQLLSEAWRAVFGRAPDPEEAFEKAIKAVEEAGAATVSPKNARTTLGTMVRDMKAQGDWRLPLVSTEADAPVRLAEAIWASQQSRHGGNAYRKPTRDEAEAAVVAAVSLVHWFASGALARRP